MGAWRQCLLDPTDGDWESPSTVPSACLPHRLVHTNEIGSVGSDFPQSLGHQEMGQSVKGSPAVGVRLNSTRGFQYQMLTSLRDCEGCYWR